MSIVDFYWQMPPISRTVASAALATSVGVYTGLLPAHWLIFHSSFLYKLPPQLWRLPTSFLITGSGMGMLFDTYFLYNYLRELEVANPRFPRRDDLVWYLMFVSGVIVALSEAMPRLTPFVDDPYMLFLKGLEIAICYTATQDMRGQKSTLWFFTIPSQLLPYCLIFMNVLQPGGMHYVPLQVCGILAAHIWDFLTRLWPQFGGGGRNLLPTPRIVSTLVARIPFGASTSGDGGGGLATTAGAGPLPKAWEVRGRGHRLGGG